MANRIKPIRNMAGQRRTATLLIKLRPLERAAVEQAAQADETSLSSVARRAILADLRRRAGDDE